jgi:hypothetical protein
MVTSVDSVALRPLPHRIVEVGHRGGLALQVALTRWRLDDELARGSNPDSRRALAMRATQLLRPRFRVGWPTASSDSSMNAMLREVRG